jgi:hypothetical protein
MPMIRTVKPASIVAKLDNERLVALLGSMARWPTSYALSYIRAAKVEAKRRNLAA